MLIQILGRQLTFQSSAEQIPACQSACLFACSPFLCESVTLFVCLFVWSLFVWENVCKSVCFMGLCTLFLVLLFCF